MVELLIDNGADFYVVDVHKNTALILAIDKGTSNKHTFLILVLV